MILGAKSGRVNALLQSFRFTSGTKLIGTANIDRAQSSTSAETGENICRKDAPYDVAEVGYIVDIRQGAGNKNIPTVRRRENWFRHFFSFSFRVSDCFLMICYGGVIGLIGLIGVMKGKGM